MRHRKRKSYNLPYYVGLDCYVRRAFLALAGCYQRPTIERQNSSIGAAFQAFLLRKARQMEFYAFFTSKAAAAY